MEINKYGQGNLTRRSLMTGLTIGIGSSLLLETSMAKAYTRLVKTSPSDIEAVKTLCSEYLKARLNVEGGKSASTKLESFVSSSDKLRNFELQRFGELQNIGSPSKWNGKIVSITSSPEFLDIREINGELLVTLFDTTNINWLSAPLKSPIIRTQTELKIVNADPIRYGLDTPDWKEINSSFRTFHQILLSKIDGQWTITADAYKEDSLAGSSPDFSDQRFSNERNFYANLIPTLEKNTSNISINMPKQYNSAMLTTYTFGYMNAVNYALNWAKSYNPAYTQFGSDCANFVSQSFKAGGYPNDSSWYPYSNSWVNNVSLRNWLIASGRGYECPSAASLGYADIVNYDWENNGLYDHVVIVTGYSSGGSPLVSAHTGAALNVPYSSYYIYAYPNLKMKFAGTYIGYTA